MRKQQIINKLMSDNSDKQLETCEAIDIPQLDITRPYQVTVDWNEKKTILWVCVNGVTVLRACRIGSLFIQGPNNLGETAQ